MTEQELIDFEKEIAELFEQGKIKAPVHLSGGNEKELIEIFKQIKPEDWVFSTHRNHYHALLKGIPKEWLKGEILAGRSITINNAEYRFFSSAIVGGILPIATGVALAGHRVWCFMGDMCATTGIFHECSRYAWGHHLPIHFIVENNNFSVDTPTKEVWGYGGKWNNIIEYEYQRKFPHQGSGGKFVIF
jgi:TPP-dependent pyruvate/acetoin dehydrogenase alpha subunit